MPSVLPRHRMAQVWHPELCASLAEPWQQAVPFRTGRPQIFSQIASMQIIMNSPFMPSSRVCLPETNQHPSAKGRNYAASSARSLHNSP